MMFKIGESVEVRMDPVTGESVKTAKCSCCGRLERSTPGENKEEFIRSLGFAGWKWKAGDWTCWRCLEGGVKA